MAAYILDPSTLDFNPARAVYKSREIQYKLFTDILDRYRWLAPASPDSASKPFSRAPGGTDLDRHESRVNRYKR
jgi:hypothetical protein